MHIRQQQQQKQRPCNLLSMCCCAANSQTIAGHFFILPILLSIKNASIFIYKWKIRAKMQQRRYRQCCAIFIQQNTLTVYALKPWWKPPYLRYQNCFCLEMKHKVVVGGKIDVERNIADRNYTNQLSHTHTLTRMHNNNSSELNITAYDNERQSFGFHLRSQS